MNRVARRKIFSHVMMSLTGLCTVITITTLFFILGYLLINGGRSLDWDFLTKLPKPPGESGGGMANAIVGSFQIIGLAAVIGIPIGFFGGIYLAEFGGSTVPFFVRYTADLLNGVPSIVIGILVWTLLVVPVHHFSALAGAFSLAIMLIPIVLRSTEQFLRSVPVTLREGAFALGASKWQAITTVVVPAASRGILTGMILGVARIAGETAPLLFTALNSQFWSSGFQQPVATLPVMIYTHAISPYDDWHRQAWAAGLVLIGTVLTANIMARLILSRGGGALKG